MPVQRGFVTDSIRRRFVLAISVMAILVAPWALAPWPQAGAQVDTTTTTEPTTTTTAAPTTTTTRRPTTTTTRRRTTTTRRPAPTTTTTTTTTTTLPPTTTVATTTTTSTLVPPQQVTTTLAPTTTTFDPRSPGGGYVPPEGEGDDDGDDSGGLPGWSLPFLGAGAMLAAIVVATGVVRFFTLGIPAIGRGLGTVAYRVSNGWAVARDGGRPPTSLTVPRPTLGARIGGFFLALTSPFRRLGRSISGESSAARRLRDQANATTLWDRMVLRIRMTRARFTRTRSSVEGQRRYWWLRFRRFIPWLR